MRLVLLPGLNGNSTLFAPLLSYLDPEIEVCTLCLPCEGKQDYQSLSDDLLEKLGESPFIMLGESFSGPLAYRLAMSQPVGLRGIIFAAAFLGRPHPLLPLLRHVLIARRLMMRSLSLRLFCLGSKASTGLVQLLRQEIQTLPNALLRKRLITLNQLQEPTQPLQIPALQLIPEHDRLVSRRTAQRLQHYCTQLTQISMAGPHFLLQSQPEACAQAIGDFITQLADK